MIRYPGSKAKLVEVIVNRFPPEMRMPLWMSNAGWEYREPFFGAGAIGWEILSMLPHSCSAWINDRDYGIVSLWKSVQDAPQELCELIAEFVPTDHAFYEFKEQDGDTKVDPVESGFRKLALHQMSYSGLGAKAGGPLGGRDQENAKYTVDCRWNPESLQRDVLTRHKLLRSRRVKITCRDFTEVIDDAENVFYYCDPPYLDKGPILYKHAFDLADHGRLSHHLKDCTQPWIVSYDDQDVIRDLYQGHDILPIDVCYTIAKESAKRRKNKEILICSRVAA